MVRFLLRRFTLILGFYYVKQLLFSWGEVVDFVLDGWPSWDGYCFDHSFLRRRRLCQRTQRAETSSFFLPIKESIDVCRIVLRPFNGLVFVYRCSILATSGALLSLKVYLTCVTRVQNRFSSIFQDSTSIQIVLQRGDQQIFHCVIGTAIGIAVLIFVIIGVYRSTSTLGVSRERTREYLTLLSVFLR